jgi:hypothetical protein
VLTYDLNADKLYFTHEQESIQIPLLRFREAGPNSEVVKMGEFTTVELNIPPSLDLDDFPSPCHTDPPFPYPPERKVAFVSRLLKDFAYQWRHVFCRTHRDITFLKLARAVLAIITLDIKIVDKEISSLEQRGWFYYPRPGVSNLELPDWKPMHRKAVIGGVEVRSSQDLKGAFDELNREVATGKEEKGQLRRRRRFLLLSVRHFMLCWTNSTTCKLEYMAPQRFINGVEPPTPEAILLLLQAFTPSYPSLCNQSRLHSLPIEIQDQIITHVAENPVEAAHVACLIGIGSPFNWMRRNTGGKREYIRSHTAVGMRRKDDRIESKVAFDGGMDVWKRLGEGKWEGICRRGDGRKGEMDEDKEGVTLFAGIIYK